MILELKNVYYSYLKGNKTRYVIDDLNVKFELGKTYALVGRSGCGKTTLLSLLAGLDLPTKGDVMYYGNSEDGVSTNTIDDYEYRKNDVSIIFQNYQLFPLLTAKENVAFPLVMDKVKEEEANKVAEDLLRLVDIEKNCDNRLPNNLSGGEQQRVAIARALISKPKIILADEPTGNLDEQSANIVVKKLMELAHNDNLCVIIVTHDQEVANACDVIYRMSEGRIVE